MGVLLVLLCGLVVGWAAPELSWWQKSPMYRIVPRVFKDNNNDGFGDLSGIISRLPHLEYLGIKVIVLGPVFPSAAYRYGYGPTGFTELDPHLGTLKDFRALMEEVHKKGMKLILDVSLSHTSSQHAWFEESSKGGGRYDDYYIWSNGITDDDGNTTPPNKWRTVFGGPAWTYVDQRQQYYLHVHTEDQPDLNFHSLQLQNKFKGIFHFWLEHEVDGFCLSGLRHPLLFSQEDYDMDTCGSPNEPCGTTEDIIHPPNFYTAIEDWRNSFDVYKEKTNFQPLLMVNTNGSSADEAMAFYEVGADLVINANLSLITSRCGGLCVYDLVKPWMERLPYGRWPAFMLGGPETSRIGSRKGLGFVNALNILALTLPGMAVLYQGDEIGMQDTPVDYEKHDKWGRDIYRAEYQQHSSESYQTPMQWEDDQNAGFSFAHTTWLPVNTNYKTRNVDHQKKDPSGHSNLQIFQKASQLRRHPSFQNRNIHYAVVNKNVFSYIRHSGESKDPGFLVTLNFGGSASTDDYREAISDYYMKGEVVLNTGQLKDSALKVGSLVTLDNIQLKPGEGLVIRLDLSSRRGAASEEL